MSGLYPLKFKTIFKEKLWGGQKIKTVLGKDFGNLDNCGETWELSGVEGNISEVTNGALVGSLLSDLIREKKADLVGEKIYEQFGNEFPLLIKFIDANQDLSIQVHPDDALALTKHNSKGKAEMWYIIQCDMGSKLYNGFQSNTKKEAFLEALKNGEIVGLINKEVVEKGDAFYLPGGRVHSIGKGMLLAEIQQTSDITYRVYDFDRIDKSGNKRELHVNDAIEAIDFSRASEVKSDYNQLVNNASPIVTSPYFTTNKLSITNSIKVDRSGLDCFKIYIGVGGSGIIANEKIKLGEVVLVPAIMKEYTIEPEGELELLETYIEG